MSKPNIEIHSRVGNNRQNWIHTAQTLFAGSKVLKRERERSLRSGQPSIEMFTVWMEIMLVAFGIECLIKAIWIKQGNQLARDGRYIPIVKNERHQLVKLCGAVGISLDPREVNALKQMSEIAGSIGRYPIGRRASQTAPRSVSWSSKDDGIIENFVLKLESDHFQPLPLESPGFQFQKRSQLFIGTYNVTLSVAAMCVCNPDRSPVGING